MKILPSRFPGVFEIHLEPRGDERGYFARTYDREIFRRNGLPTDWVQENQSFTAARHTLRGLHFQAPPHAEAKLIRVLAGSLFDVFVDLRKASSTYGQWGSMELTAENFQALLLPRGFAHGFCTLTENVLVAYKHDNAYAPGAEGGLAWNDPELAIEWPTSQPLLSDRDRNWPRFHDFHSPFA